MKRLYRKKLLQGLYNDDQNSHNPDAYLKKYDFRKCCITIASTFSELISDNLKAAWKKLLPNDISFSNKKCEKDANDNFITKDEAVKQLSGILNFILYLSYIVY